MSWIVVAGWDEFQHVDVKRSSGPPPWIKNYTRLLNDDDYLSLSPVRRCLLHGIWLAYAQTRASLNADTRKLCYRLNLRVRQNDIEALVQAGFITISASKPLALRLQDAGTTRAGEEEEVEINPKDVREEAEVERPQDFSHDLNGGEPSEMPELEQPASELAESDNDPVSSLTDRLSKGIPF